MLRIEKLSPHEWLNYERKRRGFSGTAPFARSEIDTLVSKLPFDDQEEARKVWLSRLNKTAGEIHDELMQTYINRFQIVLTANEKKIVSNCYFGIMPTQEFNAYAGRTPRGDRIVILHEALTHINAIWCHWYTRSSEEGRNTLHTKKREDEMLSYFIGIWSGKLTVVDLPDVYPLTSKQWEYSESLSIACMNFIMGHEIGHLLYDHSGYSNNQELNHEMEYQADEKGTDICIRMFIYFSSNKRSDDADAYFLAPFMSIAIMSLFKDNESITHPSATMRKNRIKKQIQSKLLQYESEVIEEHMSLLFNEVEAMFLIFSKYRNNVQKQLMSYSKPDNTWLKSILSGSDSNK